MINVENCPSFFPPPLKKGGSGWWGGRCSPIRDLCHEEKKEQETLGKKIKFSPKRIIYRLHLRSCRTRMVGRWNGSLKRTTNVPFCPSRWKDLEWEAEWWRWSVYAVLGMVDEAFLHTKSKASIYMPSPMTKCPIHSISERIGMCRQKINHHIPIWWINKQTLRPHQKVEPSVFILCWWKHQQQD